MSLTISTLTVTFSNITNNNNKPLEKCSWSHCRPRAKRAGQGSQAEPSSTQAPLPLQFAQCHKSSILHRTFAHKELLLLVTLVVVAVVGLPTKLPELNQIISEVLVFKILYLRWREAEKEERKLEKAKNFPPLLFLSNYYYIILLLNIHKDQVERRQRLLLLLLLLLPQLSLASK